MFVIGSFVRCAVANVERRQMHSNIRTVIIAIIVNEDKHGEGNRANSEQRFTAERLFRFGINFLLRMLRTELNGDLNRYCFHSN